MSGIELAELIDLTELEAIEKLKSVDMQLRVIGEDGEFFLCTADFRLDRVNVCLTNGKVSYVKGIG